MLDKMMNEAKGNRNEYIANLMKQVIERTPTYKDAKITRAPGGALKIKVTKSVTNL